MLLILEYHRMSSPLPTTNPQTPVKSDATDFLLWPFVIMTEGVRIENRLGKTFILFGLKWLGEEKIFSLSQAWISMA